MTVDQAAKRAAVWGILLPAAAIMMLTMGARQVSGLFVSPINTATGLGIVSISFALAIGQFVWGATQPIFGAAADRYGPAPAATRMPREKISPQSVRMKGVMAVPIASSRPPATTTGTGP